MRALGEGRSNFDMVVKMLALMSKSYASLSSLMGKLKISKQSHMLNVSNILNMSKPEP